jgi:L-fuculose-phosphate aldolase
MFIETQTSFGYTAPIPMISREETARLIVDVCRRLYERRLVTATDGNVSARLEGGTILVTPSGLAKARVTEADLVEVHADGVPVSAGGRPTTELGMHLFIYRERPDVAAVVHSHPPFATGLAAARRVLDFRVFPEVIVGLGEVPLAPYATPSTDEVASSIAPYVKTARAILLANHGVVTVGASLEEAFSAMEKVEGAAQALAVARMFGGARPLRAKELERLRQISLESYGKDISATVRRSPRDRRARPRRKR